MMSSLRFRPFILSTNSRCYRRSNGTAKALLRPYSGTNAISSDFQKLPPEVQRELLRHVKPKAAVATNTTKTGSTTKPSSSTYYWLLGCVSFVAAAASLPYWATQSIGNLTDRDQPLNASGVRRGAFANSGSHDAGRDPNWDWKNGRYVYPKGFAEHLKMQDPNQTDFGPDIGKMPHHQDQPTQHLFFHTPKGCTSSSPAVEEVPPEPLPTFSNLSEIQIRHSPEPRIYTDDTIDFTDHEKLLSLIFRKIGSGDKGDVYQLETLDDKLFHELQIHPSKGGVNIRGRMEDLVHVHREQHLDTPLCYASKKVDRGLNHYVLLSTKPLFDGQSKSPIISPYGETFMFVALEFDVKQKVGKVFAIFHTKEEKEAGNGRRPLFTTHQCNRKVWVVKRHGQICAAFNQWKGMAKLTCWRLIICKGEDPVLMMLLAECIDSFLPVAKSQFWKFTDNNSETNIDFPPLPDGMETKLFGK